MNALQFIAAGFWPMVAAGLLGLVYSFSGKAIRAIELRAEHGKAVAELKADMHRQLEQAYANLAAVAQRVEVFEGKLKSEGTMAAINKSFTVRR